MRVRLVQGHLINGLISIWQENGVAKSLPVRGRSMYPLIKDGDNLYIKFCKPNSIRVGDIVAFRRGKATIVHRLIRELDSGFLEKGDLQLCAEFIEPEKIMGKVEMNIKGRAYDRVNCLLTFLGYLIHRLSSVKFLAKPLLLVPFAVNAGVRTVSKYCRGHGEEVTEVQGGDGIS